jgi:hypothetical protein
VYTWRDAVRTRLYVGALLALALLWSIVPARWLFTAFVLVQFTKPLRSSGKGLSRLAFDRFWDGLPMPARSDAAYLPLDDDGGPVGGGHVADVPVQVMR